MMRALGTPLPDPPATLQHVQPLDRDGLLDALRDEGLGSIVFSPLAQGMLTDKYLGGIPDGFARVQAARRSRPEHVTDDKLARVERLNALAQARGQTLAQMALAWVLRHPEVTSALIGASRPAQIDEAVGALEKRAFTADELGEVEGILAAQK